MNRLTSDEEALIIKRLNPNLIGVAAKQYIKLYEYENLGTLEELKKLKSYIKAITGEIKSGI